MPGILFDARVIRPGMTGIGNYARSLLRALSKDNLQAGILLPFASPYAKDFTGFQIHFSRIDLTSHPVTELYEQFWIPLFCRKHGYDRFASFEGRIPFFNLGVRTYPFIYDLAYRKVPDTHGLKYSLLLRLSQWIARLRATRVITISESVKAQIVTELGVPLHRIDVVYPADSGLMDFPPEAVPEVTSPFLLATSMTNPRKNLDNLLLAFALVHADRPDLKLVVTGNPKWISERIAAHSASGVINAGFVRDGQLRALYLAAEAFVYPSRDEGFGIPLLDAALCGLCVACSDIPVFREVMGDSAIYFDPNDPQDIAKTLIAGIDHEAPPADPDAIQTRFSWKQSALALQAALETFAHHEKSSYSEKTRKASS
jgi:glycosyltransferase involved in cell wall biosynthesis